MLSRTRSSARVIVAAMLLVTLAACGDDDGSDPAAVDGDAKNETNSVSIEMKDYAYEIEGEITEGLATFKTANTGDEYHMVSFSKLKPGKTLADAQEAVTALFGGEGGEGEEGAAEESTTTTTDDSSGSSTSTSTASGSGSSSTTTAAGGEGEGEEGGPSSDVFEEDEIGNPGHILEPGAEQTITTAALEAGTYALFCYLGTEGSGEPHLARGMAASLEVKSGVSKAKAPKADATYVLDDSTEAEGPTELKAGTVTLALTGKGNSSNDFLIAQPDSGKTFADLDTFFTDAFEGEEPPAKGLASRSPGTVLASTFSIAKGETIYVTVELKKGEYVVVNTTNLEGPDGEESDDSVLKITVT